MPQFTYNNEFLNPWLVALDIALLIHFAYSYYRYCLRLGYRFDFWHFALLVGGVLPVLVNYLFAGAVENRRSVGQALSGTQANIDEAFIIQLVGYVCTYAGFYYYNFRRTGGRVAGGSLIDRAVTRASGLFSDFVSSTGLLYAHLALTLTGALFVIWGSGFNLDLRSQIINNPTLRPIYNFCFQAEGPLLLAAFWAKYFRDKRVTTLMSALVLLGMMAISGSRTSIIIPAGTLLAVWSVSRQVRVKIASIVAVMAALLAIAVAIQHQRALNSGVELKSQIGFAAELAYGNEYSDTRDFAWLLSKWDGGYLLGKTYVAGAVAFLPRAFFMTELREAWSFTFIQDDLLHLDPRTHPGVRPGRYGEMYLNFGYPPVILFGLLTGYLCRLIDDWIKLRNAGGMHDIVTDLSIAISFNFLEPFYHSVVSWTVYVLLLIFATVLLHRTISIKRLS